MANMNTILDALSSAGTIVALLSLAVDVKEHRRNERISQAQNVACWLATPLSAGWQEVVISNDNHVPIYEVSLSIDDVQSPAKYGKTGDWCSFVESVPPGIHRINVPSAGGGMCHHYGPSITFKDAKGLYWHRDVSGRLIQIHEETRKFRKLPLPTSETGVIE